MKSWVSALILPVASIREALCVINDASLQIALVVDEGRRLIGTVTDGDIRRGILRGLSLDASVTSIMNGNPRVAAAGESRDILLLKMEKQGLHHLVLVDDEGIVSGLLKIDDLIQPEIYDNNVVIMAGGMGARLRPLTETCPKPMLKVGQKPILEMILENFVSAGFYNFFFSVNYKSEMIEEYFDDGSRWGASIRYVHEPRPLRTAGALGLLPEVPDRPFFVMNGDLLTKVDFARLLKFHESHGAAATMCVRNYRVDVPYGVIETEDSRISTITEKPSLDFHVNAGIYVLSPEVLNFVSRCEPLDMPDLFRRLIDDNHKVVAFSDIEYWLDIGSYDDFHRAQMKFGQLV